MKKDELNSLKKKNKEELNKLLEEKQVELLKVRAEMKVGKEKNLKKVKLLRKYVAQVKTVLRLQEIVSGVQLEEKGGKEE